MVSCLTLVRNSHARAGRDREFSHTLCGLSISSEHAGPDLFAADPKAATCEHCKRALSSIERPDMPRETAADPKSVVVRLIGQLNGNDAHGLAQSIGGKLAADVTPARLRRLHDLFPTWQAVIDELIAERETVVLRYHVICTDPFGLLGFSDTVNRQGQAVIVRVDRRRVVEVIVIVDDFAIWTDISPQEFKSGCACHPGAPAHFQCTTERGP